MFIKSVTKTTKLKINNSIIFVNISDYVPMKHNNRNILALSFSTLVALIKCIEIDKYFNYWLSNI